MWVCSDIDLYLKGNGGIYLDGNANVISGNSTLCTTQFIYAPSICASTCVYTAGIRITSGAASGCVLTSDGSGNATW